MDDSAWDTPFDLESANFVEPSDHWLHMEDEPSDMTHAVDESSPADFDCCPQLPVGDDGSLLDLPKTVTSPDVGPVVSQNEFNALLGRALLTNCEMVSIRMPWETDFMKQFFGDDEQPVTPAFQVSEFLPLQQECDPVQTSVELSTIALTNPCLPLFSSVITSGDGRDPAELAVDMRALAIRKLVKVIMYCVLASSTGRMIAASCQVDDVEETAFEVINATVGIRSANTLLARANALLSFLRFVADKSIDDVNPFVEEVAWRYFRHLGDAGAAATRQASTLSAFRFGFHVLGIESLEHVIKSRRLIGSSEIAYSNKRLLRQALPLTTTQLKMLHEVLRSETHHIMDRALAAYLLIACYGRCRHSDLQSIAAVTCDFVSNGGFILIETAVHKCSRSAMQKSRLLPILVPTRGIDGTAWGPLAISVLFNAGANLQGEHIGPLLRAPSDVDGGLKRRGMTSAEVSQILRQFVKVPEPVDTDEAIVSSHSLKATTLSWASKCGLSPASRSILGRHSCSTNETFAVYSRDLAIGPVNELQSIIDKIHDGSFVPDGPRSHMFRDAAMKVVTLEPPPSSLPVDGPVIIKDEHDDLEGESRAKDICETSEPSDEAGSSSESSFDASPKARVKRFRVRIAENEKWYNHKKSQILHRLDEDNDALLVCGKRLTSMYAPCDRANEMNSLCKLCNRKR